MTRLTNEAIFECIRTASVATRAPVTLTNNLVSETGINLSFNGSASVALLYFTLLWANRPSIRHVRQDQLGYYDKVVAAIEILLNYGLSIPVPVTRMGSRRISFGKTNGSLGWNIRQENNVRATEVRTSQETVLQVY